MKDEVNKNIQIYNKLSKLNLTKRVKLINEKFAEALTTIESEFNISLPDNYKMILLSYEDLFFEDDIRYTPIENSPGACKDGTEMFDGFFNLDGADSLVKKIKQYIERIPSSLIPIGECSGGDLICLGIAKECRGKIYCWVHEEEYHAKK